MNKKAVIFTSIIFFSGILSVSSLAANSYSPNKFEFDDRPEDSFIWDLDVNVSEIIVSAPNKIKVEDVNKNNGKIELKAKSGIDDGVYTVSALTIDGQSIEGTFTVPILIGIATNGQVDSLSDDIDDLDERISNIKSDLESGISDVNDEIDKAKDDIEDLQDELSNVKSSGSERESKLSSLDNNLTELSAKLQNLKSDLDEAESKLKEVKSTTSTGMVFTSASLGIGILVLVVLVLYLGIKKRLFKKLIQASQQQYKEKVQKKEPWER